MRAHIFKVQIFLGGASLEISGLFVVFFGRNCGIFAISVLWLALPRHAEFRGLSMLPLVIGCMRNWMVALHR